MTVEEAIAAARARCGLADFGLSKQVVRERFKSYIETYDIPVNT